jgi:pilus assembly protein CpaD
VPRARILVGTHEAAGGDALVEIGYVGYVAQSDPCGDWSKDLAETASNQSAPNFGCAVQHNIAAMVADPRDLVQPRPSTDADAVRRNTVLGNYEKGKVTAAEKTQDQSAKVSDVGSP